MTESEQLIHPRILQKGEKNLNIVLIIDESEANRVVYTRHLERAGYLVHEAKSGEDALDSAQSSPDLILLGVQFFDVSGFEVCVRLKADPRFSRVPVILTSSFFVSGEEYRQGIDAGADAFLSISGDPLILTSTVQALIRGCHAVQVREKVQSENDIVVERLAHEYQALKESQHELEELMRLSPVPMVIFRGPEHTYFKVNAAHDRMLGKSVLGMPIREAFTKEESGEAPAILDRVFLTGEPFVSKENSYTVQGHDGALRSIWIHEWFYPLRTLDGKISGILGVSQDVTEQVLAREEVSSVLNALPAFITRVDKDERFVFVNLSNQKYFGNPENILGKTIQEFLGDNYNSFKDKVKAVLSGVAVEFVWTSPLLADGLTHQFMVNFEPERSVDGEVIGFITNAFNIDEIKSVEASLRQYESHLNLALEAGHMATWQIDLNTHELAGSPQLSILHGVSDLPPNLFVAIDQLVHWDDKDELHKAITKSENDQTPFSHQYRIVRPDGAVRWLETKGETRYDEAGNPSFMMGVVADITERKLAELDIVRDRQDLFVYFMQAPVPLVVLSGPDHHYILANLPYERLVGRKVVGKTVREAFTQEEVGTFVPLLDEVYQTGVPYVGDSLKLRVPDESGILREYWINVGYHPFRDEKGTITGIFAIHQDVTEQVESRIKIENFAQELTIERHKLETIFKESPAAMAMWRGRDLVFEKVNPVYQSWFEGRELVGRTLLDALPELVGQPFPDLLLHVFDTGEPFIGHETLAKIARRKGGPLEERYYDFTYLRVNDQDGKPYGVYDHAVDVTDRVLVRQELEKNKDQLQMLIQDLEQERELRERFVATLTHDMRNPLAAARMSAELLMRERDNRGSLEKLVGRIIDSVDRTDEMIRNLLDANRIYAGEKLPIKVSEFELSKVIREALDDLTTLYGDRFVFEEKTEIVGYWDPAAVRRVIENLCGNAVKYGSPREITITLNLLKDEISIEISVHNWGIPIPKEELETLFQYFRRQKIAQITGHLGWGIGLTLVRGIAEAHGGTALVESSEENGTTFKVTLPRDARSNLIES